MKGADVLTTALQVSAQGQVQLVGSGGESSAQASGGEHLSSAEVSSLPLNARDFSKLLLLAAGTMTDANGTANFTQQFAVNGQRGSATVFAIDGFDMAPPPDESNGRAGPRQHTAKVTADRPGAENRNLG